MSNSEECKKFQDFVKAIQKIGDSSLINWFLAEKDSIVFVVFNEKNNKSYYWVVKRKLLPGIAVKFCPFNNKDFYKTFEQFVNGPHGIERLANAWVNPLKCKALSLKTNTRNIGKKK